MCDENPLNKWVADELRCCICCSAPMDEGDIRHRAVEASSITFIALHQATAHFASDNWVSVHALSLQLIAQAAINELQELQRRAQACDPPVIIPILPAPDRQQ